MTTSLAAQLKKLAAPQTSLLTHSKKKPSLLFDPREAAKFDRDTIYEIGISGLQELIKLNPKFAEYETSLFNSDSRSVERSVEDKKVNKKLNKLIRHFLLLLSPYFLIKASHKALEWLINRYHIESFNVDDLMSLIFPYHSTRIFVRVLQIMDLSDPANKWHWLYPLQGPGVPLSKQALLNRCASDPFFMHFICKTTSDAVKEHKGRGSSLATLLAFHCTTLIGGLEYANKVNEVQMTHILKTLLEGLASPVIDYAAASYMIMGQLVLRVKLSHHIFSGILNKVVKCPHSSLSGECLLLIVLMYQNQYTEDMPPVQTKTFNRLIRLSWLPRALKQLKDAGVHVNLFFESLLREVLLNIQSRTEDREEICKFAENLLDNMMDSNSAIHIMEIILQTLDVDSLTLKEEALPEGKKDAEKENNEDDGEKKEENEDKEEEDDEEEKERIEKGKEEDGAEKKEDEDDDNEKEKNEECKEGNKHGKARQYEENKTELTTLGISDREEILKWYLQVFKNLEKKYSEAYDILIHRYLSKENASNNCARAIRLVLSVAVEGAGAGTADRIDMFQRLHHPSSALRAAAVKHLVDNYATLSEDDRELIFSSLGARLKDEDRKVLRNVLLFPTKVLVEVLGADTALEELISLSVCCFDKDKKWTEVWILLVQHLCSEQLHADTPFAEVRILFALLPFFFIHTRRICRVIMNQHNFVKKFKLLTSLTKELKPSEKLKKWEICSAFINSLTEAQTSLDTETLFQCAKYFTSKKQKAMHIFLLLLVVGSSVPEHLQLSLSQSILDLFTSCISTYKVPVVPGEIMESSGMVLSQCGKKVLSGEIPLSAYLFCISKLTQNTLLSSYLKSNDRKWWDLDFSNEDGDKTALRFTVRMLEVILTGCSASSRNVRFCYAVCLKQYFKAHFSNLASQVRFLCNVCACPGTKDDGIAWPELKLRCLRLLTTLLEVPNSSFSWALNLSEPVVPALMTAAFSPVTPLRHTALNCLLKIGSSFGANLNDDTYVALLDKIKERYEEIMMDPDQLSVVMYTALSPDPAVQSLLEPSEKPQLNGIRTTLLNCITSRDTPAYVVRTLLQMMGAINSKGIMFSLTPLGHAALKSGVLDGWLDEYRSGILCEVIQRLDSDTAECLQRKECWDFLQTALLDWKTNVIQSSGERTYPSVLVLQQISRELFDKLTETTQAELLSLIIRAASDSDAPEVGSAASKAVKKIILDSKLVATELEKMKNAEIPEEQQTASGMRLRTKRKVNQAPSPLLLQTEAWRHGVTLLEWIQSKKKLQSTQLLLSPLFSVLSKCLEFEQQPPVEYTKQLVLSCLLHCCQKLSPDGSLVDKSIVQAFNVEAIVQCIRASQNPQTHHHALLLLAHIAGMMPEQVLHNIMAIFTFMGSSVLRHDDAYSFQVISKIVDTVIPILVKASEGMTEKNLEVDGAVCSVLRVFADTVLHVPEHRRMLLYQKLLTTLGPDTSLWLFICLVLEGHVVHGQEEQSEKNKRERGEIPHRQEFALNLTRCFPPSSVITTCIKLMKYVQTLPSEKGQTAKSPKPTSSLALSLVPGLFNVDVHTAKELRHYRFSVCTFMSSLLSSPQFVKQVAELSDEDILQLEPLYQELIENLLTYIKSLSHQHHQAMQKNKPEQTIKYWSAVLNVSYDILDKVNALLPCDMFLLVIRGLLNHKLSTIRRKSMELLNTRLQHQASIFSKCERQAFYNLLEPLVTVMGSIGLEGTDPDTEINQQVAMLSIKLLARQLAPDDPAHFKQILERVIELMRSPEVQKNLLASVVLCLAELISSLRAHAIGHLNQFMPAIIGILRDQKELESPNLVLLSVVTATQKIVEILPNFLSPYLDKLLFEISIQSTKWQHLSEDNKVAPVHNKLKTIRQKISSTIPARVLTPAVGRCYTQLIEQGQYSALGPLLGILGESFSSLASSEFSQIMPDLTSFFLSALQFRGDSGDSVPQEDIVEVESHVTKALVALILKLSESTFRPLYYSLFHWATSVEAHKDRIITFYGLSSSIAEALKGLFVLFAGRLIQNAAKLLDVLNVSKKNKEEKDEKVVFDDEKAQLLLQYILQTLHRIFLHDSGQGFINKERFDALMFPLTNQLENTLGGVDQLQFRATALLSPCISQFAVAVADDALWKQLNYQILLKTRNDLPQVRLAALEVLCEMARKLGEDFLPLLPETVPFLAELLEDEEETVETACQKAVQDLEEILGEPIKKYF